MPAVNKPEVKSKPSKKTTGKSEAVTRVRTASGGKARKTAEVSGPVVTVKLGRDGSYLRPGRKGAATRNPVTLTILGTAHVSAASVRDVEVLAGRLKPDAFAVELCEPRYQNIRSAEQWQKLDIVRVIREKRLFVLMANIALSVFQKKIGEASGVRPGDEMRAAIRLAGKSKKPVLLIDREIRITLKRAWQRIGFLSRSTVIAELIAGLFAAPAPAEEIERMKQSDVMDEMFRALPPRYGFIRTIVIHERDLFLVEKLRDAVRNNPQLKSILVVVGAGHVPGMMAALESGTETDIDTLNAVRPDSRWKTILTFLVPAAILAAVLVYLGGGDSRSDLWNSFAIFAAIKAAIVGAGIIGFRPHPLGWLTAVLTAPIANFNPVLKPGWAAALSEAFFRKPLVEDFENLTQDADSLRGISRNRVFRIFLLFFTGQLLSFAGTFIALAYLGLR